MPVTQGVTVSMRDLAEAATDGMLDGGHMLESRNTRTTLGRHSVTL